MRALVTGGAGFIGSHITEGLVELGAEVLVLDDLSHGKRENVPEGAELVQTSITTPEAERIVAEFSPQALFHLAAQMDVRFSVADPAFDAETNVTGTARIANAAARSGCDAVFFASTGGAIYGEQETFPATEEHPTRSTSPYGVSKRCAELYLEYFQRIAGMRAVCLRYANVYGPRQDPHGEAGVVAIFAQKMLRGEAPTVNGDGLQTRDYVFVGDVVRANLMAWRHGTASGPFNIGTGVETDVVTLARRIAAAADYDGEVLHGPPKPGEQRRSVLDIGRAERELHWEPKTALDDGLARTVAWFREQQA
jgi:UDP-glucose 4-epimerase